MHRVKIIYIAAVLMVVAFAVPAFAEWPTTLEVGGFTVTDIRGKTEADGSGRATGRLSLPGGGNCSVDLARSASGIVTGSTRASFTINSIRIEGSFMLDRRGMQGTGTVLTRGKSISDANLSVDPKTGVSGEGIVRLGSNLSVDVSFVVSTRAVTVKGSAGCRASVDTPLANYTFKGSVSLSSSGATLAAVASGSVERNGKIGGVVSTFGPLSFDVNISSGEGRLNVGGSAITIDLW